MIEDEEGFLYPKVETTLCVDCGLCELVCPSKTRERPRVPLEVFAAKNPDEEVRLVSSSGGIFSMLAEKTINSGGVVFGARFNEDWEVEHGYAETHDGIAAFRGSKYVQSRIGESYKQAEKFLKQGRKVLFSGTPCQVAGLRRFLSKEYDNLLLVDFVCHGVPSPRVFRQYLKKLNGEVARQGEDFSFASFSSFFSKKKSSAAIKEVKIETLSFRDKRLGWKNYSLAISFSGISTAGGKKATVSISHCFSEDSFMRAFLSNMILRPSCYACMCKGGRSGSDITLGDFWGIGYIVPVIDDDYGTSLLVAYTSKGIKTIESLKIEKSTIDYQSAVSYNFALEKSVQEPPCRLLFWKLFLCKFKYNLDLALKTLHIQRVLNKLSFYFNN